MIKIIKILIIKYMLESTLTKADYFHRPLQMIFNRQEYVSTTISKILSFTIYIACFVLAIDYGKGVYLRLNPTVTTINKLVTTPPNITLINQNFSMIAQFQDNNNKPFDDPTYFNIEISHFLATRNEKGIFSSSRKVLNNTNCTDYYSYYAAANISDQFQANTLSVGSCFDMIKNNITIGGSYTGNYFSEVNYRMKPCVNSTANNNTCKSPSDINKMITGGTFNIYYVDYYIDTENFSDPFVSFLNNYYIKVDTAFTRSSNVYFRQANIFSDVGLVLSGFENRTNIISDKYNEQYSTGNGKYYLSIYVASSNNIYDISRSYMKLQTLAAVIGGIFNALSLVGLVIANYFNKYKIYENLINALFYVENNKIASGKIYNEFISKRKSANILVISNSKIEESKSDKTNDLLVIKKESERKIINELDINEKSEIENNLKSPVRKISRYLFNNSTKYSRISKETSHYNLGFFKVLSIRLFFCCSPKHKKQKKVFESAYIELIKYIDFLEIAEVLLEFRQLKKIIFNTKQAEIFKYCKKPEFNQDLVIQPTEVVKETTSQETTKIYKYIERSSKTNKINRRLLENLDKDVKNFFEYEFKLSAEN